MAIAKLASPTDKVKTVKANGSEYTEKWVEIIIIMAVIIITSSTSNIMRIFFLERKSFKTMRALVAPRTKEGL